MLVEAGPAFNLYAGVGEAARPTRNAGASDREVGAIYAGLAYQASGTDRVPRNRDGTTSQNVLVRGRVGTTEDLGSATATNDVMENQHRVGKVVRGSSGLDRKVATTGEKHPHRTAEPSGSRDVPYEAIGVT